MTVIARHFILLVSDDILNKITFTLRIQLSLAQKQKYLFVLYNSTKKLFCLKFTKNFRIIIIFINFTQVNVF